MGGPVVVAVSLELELVAIELEELCKVDEGRILVELVEGLTTVELVVLMRLEDAEEEVDFGGITEVVVVRTKVELEADEILELGIDVTEDALLEEAVEDLLVEEELAGLIEVVVVLIEVVVVLIEVGGRLKEVGGRDEVLDEVGITPAGRI